MLTSVIEQLRTCMTEFNGEVYGVSDLDSFIFEIVENKPSLYVSHFSQALGSAGRKQVLDIEHDFKVFATIPISHSDYRGEAAHDQLICLRDRILCCLWGFKPVKSLSTGECVIYKNGGLSFVDSQLVKRHKNMIIQVYSFETTEQISKAQLLSQHAKPLEFSINIRNKTDN